MQVDELAPPSYTSAYPVPQPDDPYVADLLQLADGRFAFKLLRVMLFLQCKAASLMVIASIPLSS